MNGEFDAKAVRLETARLILRSWRESDLEDLYEYTRVEGVGQMAGWAPHKDREDTRKVLHMFIRDNRTLAICDKGSGRAIGSVGLELLGNMDSSFDSLFGREIGYVLSKAYWGRGLMPEAVRAVIDYCFGVLDYDFLTCGYFVWNSQSRRVNEKLGFQFYKEIEFSTAFGTKERTNLNVLFNPNREVKLCLNC